MDILSFMIVFSCLAICLLVVTTKHNKLADDISFLHGELEFTRKKLHAFVAITVADDEKNQFELKKQQHVISEIHKDIRDLGNFIDILGDSVNDRLLLLEEETKQSLNAMSNNMALNDKVVDKLVSLHKKYLFDLVNNDKQE